MSAQAHRQALEAAQDGRRPAQRRRAAEAQPREALSRAGIAARASMRVSCAPGQKCVPRPKARCGFGVATEIETVGLDEHVRVAVGGTDAAKHRVAAADRLAAQLEVDDRRARDELRRAVEAQQLLDGGVDERVDRRAGARARRGRAAAPACRCRSGSPSSRGRRRRAPCTSRRPRASLSRSP